MKKKIHKVIFKKGLILKPFFKMYIPTTFLNIYSSSSSSARIDEIKYE